MGLFDSLLGKRKLKGPAPDRLFAMSTAYIAMDAEHGVKTTGASAIVFQSLGTGDFDQIVKETEELVRSTGEDTGTAVETSDDEYGYKWVILRDPDMEDLVVGINAVSDGLQVGGYGDRLLCAVFAFKDERGAPLYLIYNYKRGKWYPFVPAGGTQQRNTERELTMKARLSADLPIEPELERWFPLWGIPI